MTRNAAGRSVLTSFAAAALLLTAVVVTSVAQDATEDHPVVGRWSVASDEVGGAVWAFQPSGALIVSGPGEIMSQGTWTAAAGPDELDATLDVEITGQQLEVMAQVAPDSSRIALYVTATEATRPDDWHPWPPESRLVGERFGMMVEETPEPTASPLDCLRPLWVDGDVDWDRCDEVAPEV